MPPRPGASLTAGCVLCVASTPTAPGLSCAGTCVTPTQSVNLAVSVTGSPQSQTYLLQYRPVSCAATDAPSTSGGTQRVPCMYNNAQGMAGSTYPSPFAPRPSPLRRTRPMRATDQRLTSVCRVAVLCVRLPLVPVYTLQVTVRTMSSPLTLINNWHFDGSLVDGLCTGHTDAILGPGSAAYVTGAPLALVGNGMRCRLLCCAALCCAVCLEHRLISGVFGDRCSAFAGPCVRLQWSDSFTGRQCRCAAADVGLLER
jgi:hypothetical protein